MAWYHRVLASLDGLVRRRHVESETSDEIRFHLEMEARRNVEAGMSSAEAHRAAVRAFGGVARYKEEVRTERGGRWFVGLEQDVRFAIRALRLRPSFAVLATLTLALGIGATTALFGVVRAVLITPLPYGEPERIVVVWSSWTGFEQTWTSYDEFEAYQTEIPAFAGAGLFSTGAVNLLLGAEPERVRAGFVTHDVFPILGVTPLHGRNFTPDEDQPGGPAVAVIEHGLWQRRFGGDLSILGKEIAVNGRPTTVVGIIPPGLRLPLDFGLADPTGVWLPLATDAASVGAVPGPAFRQGGGNHGFYTVARLAPGATADLANAQLTAFFDRLTREGVYSPEQRFRAFAVPVVEQVTGRVRPVLLIVFGAVGFVLLIACANVAGLLLVRGEHRRRELAVRAALGAGASRLVRQILTETVVLAGIGGVFGVGLAVVGVRLVRTAAPAGLPRVAETTVDLTVLLFAVGAVLLATLLAGVVPALQTIGVAPGVELREGGRSATTGVVRLRWRQTLVAIEVALAVVLVTGAGLMIRSVANLFAIDAGIRPAGVLTMRLATPSAWYPDSIGVTAFHAELERRVAGIPGVDAVGLVRILPLATQMGDWGLQVEGYTPPQGQGTPGDWQVITPGYFQAMGLTLAAGRFLDQRDDMRAPWAMVINERFAERYLAGLDPIGRRVRVGGMPADRWATVVGIVEHVRHNGLTSEEKPQFYMTQPQFATAVGNTSRTMTLVVRSSRDLTALVRPVREIIRELDPRLPVSEVRTMKEVVDQAIAAPRFAMETLGLFALLALLLSAIGIFGIVSQVVASRSHELGIRAALGATPRDLVMLSIGTGIRQAVVGLVVGIGAALLITRVMTGLLHGVTPTDPLTLAAVVGVTAVVALVATIGPARRAARTSPGTLLHDG
jgi:predicted permease